MKNVCRTNAVHREELRYGDESDIDPLINIKSPYIIPYLGSYGERDKLIIVSEKYTTFLGSSDELCSVKLVELLPIFNALSYLHSCGICHTNITNESIIKVHGVFRLGYPGENYLYNDKNLSGNKNDVENYDIFFTIKKDYVKLKDAVLPYIHKDDKSELLKIFNEIEKCKDTEKIDGLEIFKRHISKCKVNMDTINDNNNWYKLAYERDPIISDLNSMKVFINNMEKLENETKELDKDMKESENELKELEKRIENNSNSSNFNENEKKKTEYKMRIEQIIANKEIIEEKKYFVSECYLNYIIEKKSKDEKEDFEMIKGYFFYILYNKRGNNNNNNNHDININNINNTKVIMNEKKIDENMTVKEIEKNYSIEEILNNRNTTRICLENKLYILSDYETVVFSILLTFYHNVKVLRLGKNYFNDLATRNIIKGIKNYTSLEELNVKMSHFSYISLEALSKVLINNRSLEILNMRCCREYNFNLFHVNKWDEGLRMVLCNCPKLKKLSIRSNDIHREGIRKGILDGISGMVYLEKLNLRYNNLGKKMKFTTSYDGCRIGADKRSQLSLPKSNADKEKEKKEKEEEEKDGEKLNVILSNLINLKKLDLRDNSLNETFLSKITCYNRFKNLEKIDLSDNLMNHTEKNLGIAIKELVNLKEINLDNNRLSDKGVFTILESLEDNKLTELERISLNKGYVTIKYLSLSGNLINPVKEDKKNGFNIYTPFYYLRELKNLEYFDISKNLLGRKGAANLSFFLKSAKSLKYLNISKTAIGSEGLCLIVNGMKKSCKKLEKIVMNEILLDMNGALFVEHLFRDHPSIKKIDLSFNGFSLEGNNIIINSFSNKECLEELILKGEVLTSGEISTLSAYIKNSKFNSSCMEDFSSSFISLPKLEELSLENCYIMNDSLEALCEGITNLTELKKLNLSKNSIDSKGVLKLCQCFPYISKLKTLDLSGNNLLKEGIMALCENMSNLQFLHELSLIGNNCGQDGANCLLQFVKNNKRIDIHNNFDIMSVIYKDDCIKKTVFLIKGEDRGKKAWYYVAVNSNKIAEFLTALGSSTLTLDTYGTIVSSAYGIDPPAPERMEIRQKYPFLY